MADPPPPPDPDGHTGDDTGMGPDPGSPAGMPRWVKVSGLVVGVLILLVVVIMMVGGGEHGPARHAPGDDSGGSHEGGTAPIDGGHEPPFDHG